MYRFILQAGIALAICLLHSCAKLEPSAYHAMGNDAPSVKSEKFMNDSRDACQAPWVSGNHVTTLVNGAEYFPAMLEAIESAQHTICFETFVAVDAEVTYAMVQALCRKAKSGVKVHFILDAIGSMSLGDWYWNALEEAGAEAYLYRTFGEFTNIGYNNRDHRKLLIVDGKVGFTGGAGYADCWDGDAEASWRWRDTMYQVDGPVVAELQHAFNNNWAELTGTHLLGNGYFPKLTKQGTMKTQAILGAPKERGDTLGAGYLIAIDSAKKSLLIEHAYFVPNKELRKALVRASQRGVEIDIIMPNDSIDSQTLRVTSKTHWRELMDAGMRLYEYDACMLHGKLIVVDDELSIIGSGNFDDRTFFINDEFNLHVLCKDFAREQREMFEHDLSQSNRMSYRDIAVPWKHKPLQWIGKILEPQL